MLKIIAPVKYFRILKVTTKQQFRRLVQLMEDNVEIARGKLKFGKPKSEYKQTWQRFAIELNKLGPPTRTAAEWQRVWVHYKSNIKRKLANNKNRSLNSLENSVLRILANSKQVTTSGRTCGVENTALENNALENSDIFTVNSSETVEYDNLRDIDQTFCVEDIALETRNHTNVKVENNYTPEAAGYAEYYTFYEQDQTETQNQLVETLKSLESIAQANYEINKQILKIKQRKLALYERQANEATELHNLQVEHEIMKMNKAINNT